MPNHSVLSEPQITEALRDLPCWEYREGKLHRDYRFADFLHAWDFMASCALMAHTKNHHPNWSNAYSKVEVELWTHSAGGVTELDLEMARGFEALARNLLPTEAKG